MGGHLHHLRRRRRARRISKNVGVSFRERRQPRRNIGCGLRRLRTTLEQPTTCTIHTRSNLVILAIQQAG